MLSRFWPLLGSSLGLDSLAFSPESQASTFFVVSHSIRSTCDRRGFRQIPPLASQHLAVPDVRAHRKFLSRLRLGPFNLTFCISPTFVGLANIRDPQDDAPFALQSLPDTHPCEVLLSSHEQQCQNTLHSRLPHHTLSSRPSSRSADVASKEDGQLEDVGLE